MATLRELLGTGDTRRSVVIDAVQVLEAEVADKGGLSGIAIKGAYGIVKGIKPTFIRDTVDGLLDDFLDALDPLYQEAIARGVSPRSHLLASSGRMAESLLAITDARATRAERPLVKKTYDKLRPTAKKHVEASTPRVSELLERHTRAAAASGAAPE